MRLVVIGAGPGGYETALAAASMGMEVTLFEAGKVGGTCLNEGCIPTKAFCANAGILEGMRNSTAFGISCSGIRFDMAAAVERKDTLVSQLRDGVEAMLSAAKVNLVRARAAFSDPHTVVADGKEYRADYIVIAAGSVPAFLPVEGADFPGVLDSSGMLDLKDVPARLCIIGAGVIGLEFASIFRAFGSEVTVVEFCKEILPRFDVEVARRLRQSLSRRGIAFSLSSAVERIAPSGDALEVFWDRKGKKESYAADKVLVAVGRRPRLDFLGLDAAGVEWTAKGIRVDGRMRTNVPHIFAIGDANGRQMLAHAATFQGKVALAAIAEDAALESGAGNSMPVDAVGCAVDLDVMPSAVFTMPEAATVGLSEEECQSRGLDYHAGKAFFRANGKAVAMAETDGLCKLLCAADGKILGCHVCGPHAADIVQEVSSLMSSGASVQALRSAVHIHPSLSETLLAAACACKTG